MEGDRVPSIVTLRPALGGLQGFDDLLAQMRTTLYFGTHLGVGNRHSLSVSSTMLPIAMKPPNLLYSKVTNLGSNIQMMHLLLIQFLKPTQL